MTGKWFAVFRYEFLRTFKRRSFQFLAFAVPLLLIVGFFTIRGIQEARAARGEDAPSAPAEDSPLQRAFLPLGLVDLAHLLGGKTPAGMIAYPSEEIATSALEQGTISGYYVIHADYLKTGQLDLFFDQFNLNTLSATGLRTALAEALVAKTGQNVDPQVITRLGERRPAVTNNILRDSGDTQNQHEGAALILVYVFVLFLMFSTFGTSAYLMQSVVEEKENRMVEILLSSLRPRELLAGKFIALSLLGLVQTVAWGAAILIILTQLGTVIPGVTITISTNQLIVLGIFFILGYLLFSSAYAAVGALVTNMREGPQLAVVVTLPASFPLYFIPIFVAAPGGPLAIGLSLFPLTAPVTMVARAALGEVPTEQVIVSAVILTLTVAGFVLLAARLFRVNSLLSGQMPKLRDILKLVRESA